MSFSRKFKDSGYFNWENSELTPNSVAVVHFDERFDPYNDVKIVNLSSEDIEVQVNSHSTQISPKGSELQLNQIVRKDIRLKNIGSTTISANQIRVLYRNTGHEGDKIKNIAKTIGSGALWLIR